MLWQWDFFEHRLFRCVPCGRLESGYVIKPLPSLRTAAEARTDWPGPFTLTRKELAELLLAARIWPKCSKCDGPLGGRSERGDEPERCPNCGGGLEITRGEILFD